MLKRTLAATFMLALGAAITTLGIVEAQQPPPPQPPARGEAAAMKTYRAKDLMGTKISIRGNTAVGTIDDIVFSDDGVIQYLIVSTGEEKLVTVPWDAAKFDYEKRTAMIDIPAEQFRLVPTYTVKTYPQYWTPTYRTEIYKFYGLTPGQERRLERRIGRDR
jgi:sporulation protein YlmC with PRC-barrel domain